jgi:tRNA uridine 5-carboxymethylaminomethyl modification enzyme
LGVLVDDLITLGTQEPYRMFTSRAEYRLSLREDNADQRLTPVGRKLGLVDDTRWAVFTEKLKAYEDEKKRLNSLWVHPNTDAATAVEALSGGSITHEYNVLELLKRPELTYVDLMKIEGLGPAIENSAAAEQVQIAAKYAGYIERQAQDIERNKKHENTALPVEFDYDGVSGLSNEIKQKLKDIRPETLAQASRISGVTPAAISLLLVYLKKKGMSGSLN